MMKSDLVTTNKGGVGKDFLTQLLIEARAELGQHPSLIEVEVASRLQHLAALGRIKTHGFVKFVGGREIEVDRHAAMTLWEGPLSYAVENPPTVVNVGAQGLDSLTYYLGIDVETSPLGRDGGDHGADVVAWVPTDTSKDGVAEAIKAVTALRSLLPASEIVVVGNLGADQTVIAPILAAVPGACSLIIPTAPEIEVWRVFDQAGQGFFGGLRLMTDKRGALEIAKAAGIERVVALKAIERIRAWAASILAETVAIVRATGGKGVVLEAEAAE
jgi:hypothetical protein